MKVSKLVLGSVLLFLLAFGLYAGLTTQHKSWFDWFFIVSSSLYLLYLAITYLERRLKGKKGNVFNRGILVERGRLVGFLRRLKGESPQLKDNILDIDVWSQKRFRFKVASGTVLLTLLGLALFKSSFILFESLFFFPFILAGIVIYVELVPTLGIYKNGKYLGEVYGAFIKVGDGIALGKRQDTETIGSLEILRNGRTVAELHLTAEGFMELTPDKISEVFPEIKGNIEKFKDLYKVGDYTLQYSFFTKSHSYEENHDTGRINNKINNKYAYDPSYSFLAGNVWHNHYKHRH